MDQNSNKYKLLIVGLLIDVLGIVSSSWVILGAGDFIDVAFAPLSAYLMTRMYRGTAGKVAGVVTFIEEILPFTDIIPSFTFMWLYTFVFKASEAGKVIDNDIE